MQYTSQALETAIEALTSLPTIGRKTAQRLALHLLRRPPEEVQKLASALLALTTQVGLCEQCFNFSDVPICSICSSAKRDARLICVVEEPNDVLAIERSHDYFGLYHVLHGAVNPLKGISPNDIKIKELIARINPPVQEVILAMNPNVDGELTAQYIVRLLKPLGIQVSRIARGLPDGSDLEFADDATIARALQGRVYL